MKTPDNGIARLFHVAFQILLRIIAVAGSLVVLFGLLAALLVVNFNTFTPWLLTTVADRFEGFFTFERVEIGLKESFPAFEIHNLVVNHKLDTGLVNLIAESVQIRLAKPAFSKDGLQIGYIGIVNPGITGNLSPASSQKRSRSSDSNQFNLTSITNSALFTAVQKFEIIGGNYDVVLESEQIDVNAIGRFAMQSGYVDDVYSISGSLDTALQNESKVEYKIDIFETPDGSITTTADLTAQSVDAAWIGALWAAVGKSERLVDLDKFTSVFDANLRGRWVGDTLESANWKLTAKDPELDGNIPNSKETIVKINGSWQIDDTGANLVKVDFELASLDAKVLLDLYPTIFPPKFYRHMSERLYSLWLNRMKGSFTGDPMKLVTHNDVADMIIDGDFQNLSFQYGKKWPELVDGKAEFKVRGKRLEVFGSHGTIYGQKVGKVFAYIEDITQPDPVMTVLADMDVPVQAALELFGPQGSVLPGKTDAIVSGSGQGNISLSVDVPLKRGKEFTIAGIATPGNISVVTAYGPEVTRIKGKVEFDRIGIISGKLTASVLGGTIETDFNGSGTKGNYVITGNATGLANAEELEPIIGSAYGSRLRGRLSWQADYKFAPNESNINFSTPLINVESQLPFPLKKEIGQKVMLTAFIRTFNDSERTINFDIGSLTHGNLAATLLNRTWIIHSGEVSIGTGPPRGLGSGVNIYMDLPVLNYDEWSYLIKENKSESKLQFTGLKAVKAKVGSLILARDRLLHDVRLSVNKSDEFWDIDLSSNEVVGQAKYRSTDFLQEGEFPSLKINLRKCHIPEAQGKPLDRSVNPKNLPNMEFTCADTRYGPHYLGESKIIATATADSWRVNEAKFKSPTLTINASGDWYYRQATKIRFKFDSTDFGKSMDQLGYPGKFEGGKITLSGNLHWNDALTKWSPRLTSGEFGFIARGGNVSSAAASTPTKVVGLLNYDTVLQRISVDVSDVLKDGIAYHSLAGKSTVTNGIIEVDGVQLSGPSVEIALQGTTNWVKKEHNLVAGVDSNIGKSLTTITTLINPVTGFFTYLGKELLEQMNIDVFSLQYQIGGTWDKPQVKVVRRNILTKETTITN